MGYSITIRCRSQKLKQKMLLFIEENYRNSEELFGISYHSEFTDDLSYDYSKAAIGFDYQPCPELVLFYQIIILRWMAIKIGKKDTFGKYGSVPFYLYDSYQKCPIIINKNNESAKSKNDLGFQSFSLGYNEKEKKLLEDYNKLTMEETDKKIFSELKRLNRMWERQLKREKKFKKKRKYVKR